MIHIDLIINYQMHIPHGKSGFEWFQTYLSFSLYAAPVAFSITMILSTGNGESVLER
jgi:hypothetical protein